MQFEIKVHKGESWGQDSFILKKNCLQENVQSTNMCRIATVELAEGIQVEVQVENVSGNVHLHVFAH